MKLESGTKSINPIQPALNRFAALPWPTRRAVREQIQDDLRDGKVPSSCFVSLEDVENTLPMQIGGYSDFYTSLEHCQNVCLTDPLRRNRLMK